MSCQLLLLLCLADPSVVAYPGHAKLTLSKLETPATSSPKPTASPPLIFSPSTLASLSRLALISIPVRTSASINLSGSSSYYPRAEMERSPRWGGSPRVRIQDARRLISIRSCRVIHATRLWKSMGFVSMSFTHRTRAYKTRVAQTWCLAILIAFPK